MQLTEDMLDQFRSGRFEDFLEDGAAQLQRTFPARFETFEDSDKAHDAARNIVGLSYEYACGLGRKSGLFAMRIAFCRTAFGYGVLEDARMTELKALVEAQVGAASIKPNTSIGSYLTKTRPVWEADPFAFAVKARGELLSSDIAGWGNWDPVLDYLMARHSEAGTGVNAQQLRAFVNEAFSDAQMLGVQSVEGLRLHVCMADILGRHFFDDPLLPAWGKLYQSGDEARVIRTLRDAATKDGG